MTSVWPPSCSTRSEPFEHEGVLVEGGRLERLLPVGGRAHVRDADAVGAGVDAADVFVDLLAAGDGDRRRARESGGASALRFGLAGCGVTRVDGSLSRVRVFIMSDMEGVAGVTKWAETTGGEALHAERSRLYTEEINAAVRGAFNGGATEVVVMDCHGAGEGWTFNSLIPDLLDPRCDFVVQQEWTEYTEFLEQGCDAALFVGMHAMAGTPDGVLNHTVSGTGWRNVAFNGTLVGETGINAALCGTWGCPC